MRCHRNAVKNPSRQKKHRKILNGRPSLDQKIVAGGEAAGGGGGVSPEQHGGAAGRNLPTTLTPAGWQRAQGDGVRWCFEVGLGAFKGGSKSLGTTGFWKHFSFYPLLFSWVRGIFDPQPSQKTCCRSRHCVCWPVLTSDHRHSRPSRPERFLRSDVKEKWIDCIFFFGTSSDLLEKLIKTQGCFAGPIFPIDKKSLGSIEVLGLTATWSVGGLANFWWVRCPLNVGFAQVIQGEKPELVLYSLQSPGFRSR